MQSNGVCECANYIEVPKLVAKAGCAEDAAAVAALPEEWTPKRGGPVLANYLKRREQDHQDVLQAFADSAAKQNASIDDRIRTLAQNLLAHIKQNETDINCVEEYYNTGKLLSCNERTKALQNVSRLYSQRIEDLSNFKREALALENERAAGLSELLRDHFHRLVAVGNQPPKVLLHEFDERTYEANQQLLSNSRAYAELEAKLRFQADESVRRAKSSLNQLCLGVQFSARRSSAHPLPQNVNRSFQSTRSADSKKSLDLPQVESILDSVFKIEECVSRIVDAYRDIITQAVTTFSGKLSDLRAGLENRGSNFDFRQQDEEELHQMVKLALAKINRKLPTSNRIIPLLDISRLQNCLDNLGRRLQTTYHVLRDAGHLWDAHIMRSALVQKLTMAAVEDLLTNNDCIELANEVQFNIAFEMMRSCSEPEKIQHQHDDLIGLLENTAELYLQHREAELVRLQEFLNVVPSMADTLLAEFQCFLDKNPKEIYDTSCLELSKISSCTMSETSPIVRIVLQSEMHATALSHWKNGLLESFECSFTQVPEDLREQAEVWVEEKKSALDLRYAMKMMSHSIRPERVKGALESRLSQIRHHDSRLTRHLDAVSAFIDNLPQKLQEDISFEMTELYPIHRWIDNIQTQMDELQAREILDPETKRLKMMSFAKRLAKHTRLFSDSLEEVFMEYKKDLEYRIQAVRISNVRFLSAIKLFYEGGCYAAQESLKTLTAIVKASEALELCALKSSDLLNQRHSQLLSLVEERVANLRRMTGDYVKPLGKTVIKKTQSSMQTRKKK